jgi:uncharacterized membrane protein
MKPWLNLIFLFLFASTAFARPNNFDSAYLAQRVSMVLKDAVTGKYVLDVSRLPQEDREQIALLANLDTSRLNISVQKNVLIINQDSKAVAVIDFTRDAIHLNGAEIKLNPSISMTQNLRNWAIRKKQSQKTSKVQRLWGGLISQAAAAEPSEEAKKILKALGSTALEVVDDIDTVVTSAALAAKATGRTVVMGAATGTGALLVSPAYALAVLIAATVAALLIVGVIGWCEQEMLARAAEGSSVSRERFNCYSKPLSWMNINPRDRYHAQDFNCSPDGKSVVIALESETHKESKIEVKFEQGRLKEILPVSSDPAVTASFAKSAEAKKVKELLSKQVPYLQKICSDPKTLQAFKTAAEAEHSMGRIIKGSPDAKVPGTK